MDHGDARLRVGPDVVDLRQAAQFLLDPSSDELLYVLGLHAGELGAYDDLADHDRGVLLARKGEELSHPCYDHPDNED